MDYTTTAKVQEYTDVAQEDVSLVAELITDVSREMDRMANRTLVCDEIVSGEDTPIKYFDGDGTSQYFIDDAWNIEKVEVGDAWGDNFVENTEYVAYPVDAPHKALIFKSASPVKGFQNIKVTANFGLFETTPADIEFACTVLVAGILNSKNSNGEITSERIGNYSVSYDTAQGGQDYKRALEIINSYRRINF